MTKKRSFLSMIVAAPNAAVRSQYRPSAVRAVQQENGAGRRDPQQILALEKCELVAGDEACLRRSDRARWIGSGPKRRCDTVCAPDLWES